MIPWDYLRNLVNIGTDTLLGFCALPLVAASVFVFSLVCSTEVSLASAKGGIQCNFRSISGNCEMFSKAGESKIQFSDGSSILNILSEVPVEDDQSAEGRAEVQLNDASDMGDFIEGVTEAMNSAMNVNRDYNLKSVTLDFQLEKDLMTLLDSSKDLSEEAKMFLAGDPHLIISLYGLSEGLGISEETAYELPMLWPLTKGKVGGAEPSIQYVSNYEVKKELDKILGTRLVDKVDQLSVKYRADLNELNESIEGSSYQIFTFSGGVYTEEERLSTQQKDKVDILFERVRDRMIANLVGEKPPAQWTQAEKAAVEKLKAIQLIPGDDDRAYYSEICSGEMPNAFYNPSANTMSICANFYDYPEESLAMVLAHEMGHAIDPCNSQFGMYQVDVKKFMQLDPSSTDDEVVQQILADDDLIFFMEHVDQNVTEENSQISDKVKMYLSDPGKLKYFEDLGIISLKTEPPPEVSQRGNHLYGYVLQDVYSCLQPKEGIRSVTKSDIEVAVNSYIQERLAIMGDTFDVESEKEKLTSAFTKYPQCFGPGSSGQMGEAMSDWWGAKVVGDMYSDREYKTDKERLRPYAFWIGQLCYQRANYEYLDTNEASVAEIAYQVIGNQYRNNMSHPKSIARLEKIFLSDPRMREAMGCEPTQEPLCSHSISGSGESRGDSRSQQSGGTR